LVPITPKEGAGLKRGEENKGARCAKEPFADSVESKEKSRRKMKKGGGPENWPPKDQSDAFTSGRSSTIRGSKE